jgi:hypothetical protein
MKGEKGQIGRAEVYNPSGWKDWEKPKMEILVKKE